MHSDACTGVSSRKTQRLPQCVAMLRRRFDSRIPLPGSCVHIGGCVVTSLNPPQCSSPARRNGCGSRAALGRRRCKGGAAQYWSRRTRRGCPRHARHTGGAAARGGQAAAAQAEPRRRRRQNADRVFCNGILWLRQFRNGWTRGDHTEFEATILGHRRCGAAGGD